MFQTHKPEPEKAEAPKVESAAATARQKKKEIEDVVMSWFDDRIRNSPVAHHSEGWNHLVQSLPVLIKKLTSEI